MQICLYNPRQRLFYPDYSRLVTGLNTVKCGLDSTFSDPALLREYLLELYNGARGFSVPAADEDLSCGAPLPAQSVTVVCNDNALKKALDEAKAGDTVLIRGNAVIDMSDWILGGDTVGFTMESGKIKYEMVIPEGVTLMGERGRGDCGGAIIKVTSYTDIAMRLKKNARVTGLCIQGPDSPSTAYKSQANHSRGILLDGCGARMDNCEIAGFFRTAVVAGDHSSLSVDHCYIHHILSENGVVFDCQGAGLSAKDNFYAHVNSLFTGKTPLFEGAAAVGLVNKPTTDDAFLTILPVEKKKSFSGIPSVPFSVLSGSYYPSTDDLPYVLLRAVLAADDEEICERMRGAVNQILSGICSLTNYLPYLDGSRLSREIDGETFGAISDEKGNIGGGAGYYRIFTERDATFVVTDEDGLKAALEKADEGDIIFIPSRVSIDFSDAAAGVLRSMKIERSITLCSDRGAPLPDGTLSTGALLSSTHLTPAALFEIAADNVHFSGLRLQGPDPADHDAHHTRAFLGDIKPPLSRKYFYNLQNSNGINVRASGFELENCELSGFSCAAVLLNGNAAGQPTENNSVHHCYIHHNRLKGLGYGVVHGSSFSRVYCNLFNYNRHSIAGSGNIRSGYFAYNNIEMGTALSANCDMHGGGDRKDGTDIAGEYCYIYQNTYLGKRPPYNVRGVPTKERTFHHNIVFRPREEYEDALTHNRFHPETRLDNAYIGKNIWGVRDGDGVLLDEGGGGQY